ncbi:phenylalanine--tRNA ligase subunit beta [Candidatus Beckwithbacteria bacterium CG10_big_fil_rev_8_21_14_0_10_34_10]|uniref:Phenylalanine--tRNA ligase beta subunit n=1 Tax=Candidatus Beckwithbacteria bacterium CG10_big_fil_rev_8_21_14_0_10_34_10 TaxID=1974495 RepID=A0A2H0WAG7_9BACT|nr:MAG: phenylalanine--tRNA ligase subunit beta [Candidatus Beckwithbacteria bacterium CG10_big_fil_rev_8_21_14_0_10_34_10]
MNILIPHNWLKEYLETNASPKKIADCLSLCGASVEKVIKKNSNYVYDIEITTNRVDMMSVLGIARELSVILPQFGIKARLKKDPYKLLDQRPSPKYGLKRILDLTIQDSKICPRFTAVVIKNLKIKPSPKLIQERLILAGLRPINNIVDLTNYLMRELGQPFHAFDWNEIKKQKMVLRLSKKGEKITTLDGKTFDLPGDDIIIEDGDKRIIDLCGIMGGKNSQITSKTKSILLFVQTYDPRLIRKSSMNLSQRTEASALFEKSPDPEMVLPALYKGIDLLKKNAQGEIGSKIIDVYNKPYKVKNVDLNHLLIEQYLSFKIKPIKVIKILKSLGFETKYKQSKNTYLVSIPSWRAKDINLQEDLIEEIARIYGYHNLPSKLPRAVVGYQSPNKSDLEWEKKIKTLLKGWGLTEIMTYTMQSRKQIINFNLDPTFHLEIKNPLIQDWQYLRKNLLPSILSVIKDNLGKSDNLKLFEIGDVFIPQNNNLPLEKRKLAIVFSKDRFFELKGILESMFKEIGILKVVFKKAKNINPSTWQSAKTATIYAKKNGQEINLGKIGLLSEVKTNFEIKDELILAYLNFDNLTRLASKKKIYQPIPKYPALIEDLTFTLDRSVYYGSLEKLILNTNPLVKKVEFLNKFKRNLSLRIYYQDSKKNLTDKEIEKIRKQIILKVQRKGWGRLLGKV